MSLFEKATRMKLRISTDKGSLSVEDLWDLSLEKLDNIYKAANSSLKASEADSLLEKKSSANEITELIVDIVKHIVNIKLEEAKALRVKRENAAKRAKIMELMERKKDEALSSKTLEELEEELQSLGN